jgi:LacI family transcriptional regulator
MRDVSRVAGVSTSTVSHVVNGTRRVSDELRQRVLNAVDAVQYRQDALARAMRMSRTNTIGLVISDAGDHVFADMVRGIEHEAREHGITPLLANTGEELERQQTSVRALLSRRVDGLLLTEVPGTPDEFLDELLKEIPVVLMDRLSTHGLDQVGTDSTVATRLLVEHLVELGHRDIAALVGDTRVPTLREREQGYLEALERAGLPARGDRVLGVDKITTRAAARSVVGPLFSGSERPTAIISASHSAGTAGILDALRELGLTVPEDVALVIFDLFQYSDLFTPKLTGLVQPGYRIGQEAMRLLLSRLEHPDAEPQTIRLRPTFIHGESCGCPPGTPAPSGWQA